MQPTSVRDFVRTIQKELRESVDLLPDRASELLNQATALLGNCNDELRAADQAYKQILLHCLRTAEKANRAKIEAETLLAAVNVRDLAVAFTRGRDTFRLLLDGLTGCHAGPIEAVPLPPRLPGLDWVIVGGESGPSARPCAIEWIESVVAQCRAASVPVFVKQLGAYVVSEERTMPAGDVFSPAKLKLEHFSTQTPDEVWAWRAGLRDRKGGTPDEWPADLRVREFPEARG